MSTIGKGLRRRSQWEDKDKLHAHRISVAVGQSARRFLQTSSLQSGSHHLCVKDKGHRWGLNSRSGKGQRDMSVPPFEDKHRTQQRWDLMSSLQIDKMKTNNQVGERAIHARHSQKDTHMANEHRRRCPILLVIREM